MSLTLAQRRTLQEFQDATYNNWKESFTKQIGYSIEIEPLWDTFFKGTEQMSADTIKNCWKEFYFDSLDATIKLVGSDEMGKTAMREGFKKIVIDGDVQSSLPEKSTFKDGVFTLNHPPTSHSSNTDERAKAWQKIIEAAL